MGAKERCVQGALVTGLKIWKPELAWKEDARSRKCTNEMTLVTNTVFLEHKISEQTPRFHGSTLNTVNQEGNIHTTHTNQ